MSRDVFVSLDGGDALSMRLDLSGRGHIPAGMRTRGRLLYPFGRPRLIDPKDWIELEITGMATKIGNAAVYSARRLASAPREVQRNLPEASHDVP